MTRQRFPVRRLIRDISSVLILSGLLLVLDAGVTLIWQEPVTAAIGVIMRGQVNQRYLSYKTAPLTGSDVKALHTIKPLDTALLTQIATDTGAIITVEEHMIHGGLGEACAAVLLQAGVQVPFHIVGFPDEETVPGAQADIFRHYGISMEGLAETALKALQSGSIKKIPHIA